MVVVMRLVLALIIAIVECEASVIPRTDENEIEAYNGVLNQYYLYTRLNPDSPQRIRLTQASIQNSSLNLQRHTAFIVHGHDAGPFNSLNPVVKDALLESENINVIVVDWEIFAGQMYSRAIKAVPSIGEGIANLIKLLVAENKISLDRLHLIGFDLGAHVLGYTGRFLNGQVARITGLDPSGNSWGNRSGRLSIEDARYVEVIHTDGNGLLANGIETAIGHVDFFVNGGGNQPGCVFHACSHDRAWELFAATLNHDHLFGNSCSNTLQVNLDRCYGPQLPVGKNYFVKFGSGMYRVNTGRRFPF